MSTRVPTAQSARLLLMLLPLTYCCQPPDCDRPDFGTCGVACCMLLVRVTNVSSSDLMMALNTSLAKGGPDGRFTLKPTAESPYGFGDLRPYHPDTVSFIGQAFHLTANRTYTDTLNFLILKESMSATLKVHSISQIGGAYGDDGQNYKNIAVLLKSLNVTFVELENNGCALPPVTLASPAIAN